MGHKSVGHLLLKIALAVYLIVTALCVFGVGSSIKSNQVAVAIRQVFGNGDFAKIIAIIIGIVLFCCGVVCAIDIFRDLGKWDNTIMLIMIIVWIVIAVLVDIFSKGYGIGTIGKEPLTWFLNVAKDLLIIGGLLTIKD